VPASTAASAGPSVVEASFPPELEPELSPPLLLLLLLSAVASTPLSTALSTALSTVPSVLLSSRLESPRKLASTPAHWVEQLLFAQTARAWLGPWQEDSSSLAAQPSAVLPVAQMQLV
jgi:hypothetical protein